MKKFFKTLFKTVLYILLAVIVIAGTFTAFMVYRPAESRGEYLVTNEYEVKAEYQTKVILDCDNSLGSFWEVDDGLVLSYLLNKPEANLLGVTTTFGNRTYNHKYTVKQLAQADREDVSLFKGEQKPNDGVTAAARFIAEEVAKYPGEVTIIAAGPVGNVAAAAEIDSNFYENVKEIVIMGGYTEDLSLGSREIDELNLSADYKATHEIINSGAKVTIMTGQACLDAPFYFSDLRKLENFPANWKFFLFFWTGLQKVGLGNDFFVLWDLLPTVYAFHPEYFEENLVHINSTLDDLQTGMLKITDDESAPVINLPNGIANTDAFFEDLFIHWNKQGK